MNAIDLRVAPLALGYADDLAVTAAGNLKRVVRFAAPDWTVEPGPERMFRDAGNQDDLAPAERLTLVGGVGCARLLMGWDGNRAGAGRRGCRHGRHKYPSLLTAWNLPS